jgi:tRNA (guanine37-N1)-methyltransferase
MRVDILSLFPGYFRGPLEESILKRAQESGLMQVGLVDIRDFSDNKHNKVDDRPYGGGPGMVLMPGPVARAIASVRQPTSRVIHLTPQGTPFSAAKAQELAGYEHLIFLCGHYEGVDQRVIDREVDEEISIGDYVLTNGCLAALVVIDAASRFIPGVLGDEESAQQDSFQESLLDCPHYTRPEVFEGVAVPEVLLSGHHQKIAEWRRETALEKTRRVRPDLLAHRGQ